MAPVRGALEQRGAHLRASGVVQADEQSGCHQPPATRQMLTLACSDAGNALITKQYWIRDNYLAVPLYDSSHGVFFS